MPMSKSLSLKQMLYYSKKPCTTGKTLCKYATWLDEQEEAISESIECCKSAVECSVECSDEMLFMGECFELVKQIAWHPNVEQATLCNLVLLAMDWSAAELVMEIIEPINDPYTLWKIYEEMKVRTFDWEYEDWENIRQALASKDVSNAYCFNNIEYPDCYYTGDDDDDYCDDEYCCDDDDCDDDDDYWDDDDCDDEDSYGCDDRHFAEEFWGPAFDDAMEK